MNILSFILKILWLGWCWFEVAIFTLILYALSWLPKPFIQPYYHYLFRLWCRFFVLALGVDLRLHEKNISPIPKQYILIANHPSAFEDVGISSLFDIYPLAKYGVRNWFLVGRINMAADTLFVKRGNPESRRAVVSDMIQRLKQGDNIALFPEGGCMGRRIYKLFRTGAFEVSMETGIPILPVFLHYEAQETFEWRDPQTLIAKFWHFMSSQNNRANYYRYDAIYPDNFTDKKEYAEHVRQQFLKWQSIYLE